MPTFHKVHVHMCYQKLIIHVLCLWTISAKSTPGHVIECYTFKYKIDTGKLTYWPHGIKIDGDKIWTLILGYCQLPFCTFISSFCILYCKQVISYWTYLKKINWLWTQIEMNWLWTRAIKSRDIFKYIKHIFIFKMFT